MPHNDAFNSDGGLLRLSSDVWLVDKDGSESRLFSPCSPKRSSSSFMAAQQTQLSNITSASSFRGGWTSSNKNDELGSPLSLHNNSNSLFGHRAGIDKSVAVPLVFSGKELLFKVLIKDDDLKKDASRMQDASDSNRYDDYIKYSMELMRKISGILFEEGDSDHNKKTMEMAKEVISALTQEVSRQSVVGLSLQR